MSQPDDPTGGQPDVHADPDRGARKPYRKPEFTREQLFETMALACGKANVTINQCKLIKKNS